MNKFKKEDYYIKIVPSTIANHVLLNFHYLHRLPASVYRYFGLYTKKDNVLVGVASYGYPHSYKLRLTFGEPYKQEVLELSRLWISQSVPKNGASFFISNTIKLLDKKIIYSFADLNQGHTGQVYVNSNWMYLGESRDKYKYIVEGHPELKNIKYNYNYKISELRKQYGDKVKTVKILPKRRFLYLNCDKREKKVLLSLLKYPILQLPKEKAHRSGPNLNHIK